MAEAFTFEPPVALDVVREKNAWSVAVDGHDVRLSNLDKIFWGPEGYTKGDLLAYYHAVAAFILPHLHDRPLTMKRMPDGADGPFFYEKNAPKHTPDWIPRCDVASEPGAEPIGFLMAQDSASLLFVANLGCIEFHPLHSRCDAPDRPDYLFFDLDPAEGATFDDVLAVAMHVKAALDVFGLPSVPKTSGATGIQIFVPLLRGPSYEVVRDFVATLGRAIRDTDRNRVTMEWDIPKRHGKVFIDHNMNRRGQNIASVYSVRPERGASVSTPLTWDEVSSGVHPSDFTIQTIHERLARDGDLFTPVLTQPVDLRPVLDRLGLDSEFDLQDAPDTNRLASYTAKRDFGRTPEPAPALDRTGGHRFVIQKHDARRLHYDLRFERDGVLVSWAVPKGLPTRIGDKHLAIQTEDHPIEYATFEGWIPKGEYGGGEVKIFDEGTYEALEWEPGRKVTVRLHGKRHQGEYHMFHTAKGWLITLAKVSEAVQSPPAPSMTPMLAVGGHKPFSDPQWRFEPKLDGVRTLAYVTPDATRLISRTGRDHSVSYPELTTLAQHVNALSAVIDGEIVALDDEGRPDFGLLQRRIHVTSAGDIQRLRRDVPVYLYAFDILWLDGQDLTARPLESRRASLEAVVTQAGPVQLTIYSDHNGLEFFAAVAELGLEGMVAKKLGSVYRPGQRSPDWRKVKAMKRMSAVVVGWTLGSGARANTLGALLLAAYVDEALKFIGQVGSGFTDRMLTELRGRLEELEVPDPPLQDADLAAVKGARFVSPDLVVEVEYLQLTKAARLRAPSYKGLRSDKLAAECQLPSEVGQ